ncbi:MAG: YggS family pyridoxal phosphate-dependent enzyme [Clostridia bacterium]|nr:YggS family pyridoxal phosphate-dependent enzyme [Clostridia bacterium]
MENIEQNVKKLLSEIPAVNPFGEKVTLVAAVKLQSPNDINRAISAGITDIGDNHVQEFRDKYADITPNARRHFIGHLQTNKIKYLLGKVDLYHSVDRLNLAEELSKRSAAAGITSEILIQINAGDEDTKGGFSIEETLDAYQRIKQLPALKISGLMAMFPFTDDERLLTSLAVKMREKYDILHGLDQNIKYLSMGMSGDWRLCIQAGSNMIRLGTAIFGTRNYQQK